MDIKKRKIICFMMIILVAVSGICFKNIKPIYDIYNSPVEKASSYIIAKLHWAVTDVQTVANKQSDIRQDSGDGHSSIRMAGSKRDITPFFEYLLSDSVSLNEGSFFAGQTLVQFFNCMEKELVANYIHKSDGKK